MITTLDDGYLHLDPYFYTKGKKKDKKWIPQKNVNSPWEIIITAYSKQYVRKNSDLFQKLLQKLRKEQNKESL